MWSYRGFIKSNCDDVYYKKMRGPIDVLFAFKIFSLPVPTRPGTRTFWQVPDQSRPEVKNPYPSDPAVDHWSMIQIQSGGPFWNSFFLFSPHTDWRGHHPNPSEKVSLNLIEVFVRMHLYRTSISSGGVLCAEQSANWFDHISQKLAALDPFSDQLPPQCSITD